jgi:hypothetical protein
MVRSLKAIEIAEGALLADIAVVFHLLATYLPVGGGFFTLLIFVVFCVLVLRRGLYVGIMALCVSLFITAVLMGLSGVPFLFLEIVGGLFLGVTMQRRMYHIPLLLLGITCGTLSFYGVIILLTLLTGVPLTSFVHSLSISFHGLLNVAGAMSTRVGLGLWWIHQARPSVAAFFAFLITYWWAALYIFLWIGMSPFICAIYLFTNTLVRLLGYEVRPFPGNRINKFLRRTRHRLIRLLRKQHIIKIRVLGSRS